MKVLKHVSHYKEKWEAPLKFCVHFLIMAEKRKRFSIRLQHSQKKNSEGRLNSSF